MILEGLIFILLSAIFYELVGAQKKKCQYFPQYSLVQNDKIFCIDLKHYF